ncbi:Rieske (2Fe-2S) protein [Cellulomonas terrae]|uniref:tRNA-(Guanine-N1)-methyltransferase n=1 Tax=Cellulomonas terrae TaxID=311234 RepID=A0A511JIY8_9CELL|nr:Rieske (2Fe-2S) protein [Cellulomonas terrae]GEL97982.1 tRNA-(guanine-N1)-methyltransferase [Cellulomonas terrae]
MSTQAVDVEHVLGRLSEIPLGEGRAYAVAGRQVAVFRLRDGTVRALDAVCPHRGGPLADGQTDADVVVCPLHAHVFDLRTGACRSGSGDVRSYPARVEGGQVVVALPGPPGTSGSADRTG